MPKWYPGQKVIALALLLFAIISVVAQSDNVNQTRAAGDWDNNSTRQVRIGDYPGAASGTESVNKKNNSTVIVSITTHPADFSGCAPTFTVVANGVPVLTYQWQEDNGGGFLNISDGGVYSGATTASLSISGTPAMTGYLYRCVVTDGSPDTQTSNAAIYTYSLPEVSMGYNYSMPITLDAASGSSDLIDFPVLISITDLNLRTDANGGNVLNANGYDIIFTDINGSRLDHDLESFDGATGEYIAWVRIPTLAYDDVTDIFIKYGNSSVTTDQSDRKSVV